MSLPDFSFGLGIGPGLEHPVYRTPVGTLGLGLNWNLENESAGLLETMYMEGYISTRAYSLTLGGLPDSNEG